MAHIFVMMASWLIALGLFSPIQIIAARHTLTRSLFPSGGELVIEAPLGCAFDIYGREQEDVSISIDSALTLSASDWSWMIREEQAVFSVKKRVSSGRILIAVPAEIRLVIDSRAGHLALDGLSGTVVVNLKSGKLSLFGLSGVMDVWTGSGDLWIENCSAIGRAQSDDGQIWCRNVSHDLIVKTGVWGSIVHTDLLDKGAVLLSWGTDLQLGSTEKSRYSELRTERGFLTIGRVDRPVSLLLKTASVSLAEVTEHVDMTLVNGRGLLTLGEACDGGSEIELKLLESHITVNDGQKRIGSIMLSLTESKPNHTFLALPFERIRPVKNGSIVQLSASFGSSRLKAELYDSVLAIPELSRLHNDRRTR